MSQNDDAGRLERRVRPCPFCGKSAITEESTGCLEIGGHISQDCWMECSDCKGQGPIISLHDDDNYQRVRDAWNKRA
jgi:hypothetical protein